jgi:hypothetical protein
MYRLFRFVMLGVWDMPPKHKHHWIVIREGRTTYGPVVVLQCDGCGDCKIVE